VIIFIIMIKLGPDQSEIPSYFHHYFFISHTRYGPTTLTPTERYQNEYKSAET